MLLQGQHTLPEVLAVVESQDAAVKARYSTNADTPQNKAQIKAEQDLHTALSNFIKTVTKGYKGVPSAGLILDYDVSPRSVRVNLQFSATESRDVGDEAPKTSARKSGKKSGLKTTSESKSKSAGASKSGKARSGTTESESARDRS
jgi:hypothetical protein